VTLAEIAAGLSSVLNEIARQRVLAASAAQALTRARDGIAASTKDSRHPLAARAVAGLSTAIDKLRQADQDAAASVAAIAGYARIAGINLSTASGQDVAAPTAVDGPAGGLDDLLSSPGQIRQWICDAGTSLPRRPGGKGPTHGALYDPRGQQLANPPLTQSGGTLRSGGASGVRAGLRVEWHSLAQATREHVESHAAAILRKPAAPQEAVLVINKPTCVSRGEYVGCDEILPAMLPVGKRLAVYVTDGTRTTLSRVYTGTGEGIAP
jgi:hypothetical protein